MSCDPCDRCCSDRSMHRGRSCSRSCKDGNRRIDCVRKTIQDTCKRRSDDCVHGGMTPKERAKERKRNEKERKKREKETKKECKREVKQINKEVKRKEKERRKRVKERIKMLKAELKDCCR